MTSAPAQIVVLQGTLGDQEYELVHIQSSIGRSSDNDIPIPDPEVSRRHAQITQSGSQYSINDLGSTNGTFVNEQRVEQPTLLQSGDSIRLGDTINLRFFQEDPQATVFEPAVPSTPDEEDTAPLPPLPPEMMATPTPTEPLLVEDPQTEPTSSRRRLIIGCGVLLLLVFICAATLFFLDSYENGRLLYCGALRPSWQSIANLLGQTLNCP